MQIIPSTRAGQRGFCLVLAVVALAFGGGCATQAPTAASRQLPVPGNGAERAYLGVTAKTGSFQLANIQCDILVIDCFDLYCHNCWADAPRMNELYRLVQAHHLGDRIKFIGLGVGDTPLEAATYKHKFHVPYPVFSDRFAIITQRFGPLRLPNLLVLRKLNGHLILIQSVTGALLDPAGLFAHLRAELAATHLHSWSTIAQLDQPTCGIESCNCPYSQTQKETPVLPFF